MCFVSLQVCEKRAVQQTSHSVDFYHPACGLFCYSDFCYPPGQVQRKNSTCNSLIRVCTIFFIFFFYRCLLKILFLKSIYIYIAFSQLSQPFVNMLASSAQRTLWHLGWCGQGLNYYPLMTEQMFNYAHIYAYYYITISPWCNTTCCFNLESLCDHIIQKKACLPSCYLTTDNVKKFLF